MNCRFTLLFVIVWNLQFQEGLHIEIVKHKSVWNITFGKMVGLCWCVVLVVVVRVDYGVGKGILGKEVTEIGGNRTDFGKLYN